MADGNTTVVRSNNFSRCFIVFQSIERSEIVVRIYRLEKQLRTVAAYLII